MSDPLTARAPAKINLSLRILGRRDDGFHELVTRMCPLALADDLTFTPRDHGGATLQCDDPALPTGEDNLVLKAVRAFEAAANRTVHGTLSLTKRIPSGGGLGGGSSDAAATLGLLNRATAAGFDRARLAAIASQIGSDVPFFVYGGVCDASGRGEIVTPVDFPQRFRALLVKPPFGVATPWAYQRWRDSVENPAFNYSPQPTSVGELVNDLERPVFEKFVLLGDLKRWLGAQPGVEAAMMSGSGATVFALLEADADGEALAAETRAQFGSTFWTCVTSSAR